MASRSKHLWSHAYKSQQLLRMRNCHYNYCTILKKPIHSNCSPEMTLNIISKSVACTFFLQTQPASFYNLCRQPTLLGLSRGKASCFLHAEHEVFLFGSVNSQAFQAHGGKISSLMKTCYF